MPLWVDVEANRVFLYDAELMLSGVEYQLLRVLWLNRGRIVTFTTLINEVWVDLGMEGDVHMLGVTILRLRRKIGTNVIITRRGIGYGIL